MKITDAHTLDTATPRAIAGGAPQDTRRLLVVHFTGGATGESSIEAMIERGVSAHLVIERDGKIWQCRPFNRSAGHAGGRGLSRWRDPDNGVLYDGVNGCGSIGIELANAGNDPGALAWTKHHGGKTAMAKHRNGGPLQEWELYPDAQLNQLWEVTRLLMARYRLDDITGHDCIAPERKEDPGPLFPMLELRAPYFPGLPAVFQK